MSQGRVDWNDRRARAKALRDLMATLDKGPTEVTTNDLKDHGLGSLLVHGRLYDLLIEAGFELRPWQMVKAPNGLWDSKANRREAILWLLEVTGKDPDQLCWRDLHENSLNGLWQCTGKLLKHSGKTTDTTSRLVHLLNEAGLPGAAKALKRNAEERERRTRERAADRRRRSRRHARVREENARRRRTFGRDRAREIVREICKRTDKDPIELSTADFIDAGYLLEVRLVGGIHPLLREAGLDIEPWEMKNVPPGMWRDPAKRAGAFRWLVERTGKEPHQITDTDMLEHGLSALRNYDLKGLMRGAGLDTPRWRIHHYRNRWDDKERRVSATRWLARTVGKRGSELELSDFRANGLITLFLFYFPAKCKDVAKGELLGHGKGWLLEYKNPALRAAAEAGLLDRREDRDARKRWPPRKYGSAEARRKAIRKAVERSGRRPENINISCLRKEGLKWLMKKYYDNDVLRALRDAGYDVTRDTFVGRKVRSKWEDPENRKRAVREYVESTGLSPERLTASDFYDAGYGAMFKYKKFWELLREAGYDVIPWKMKVVPHGFWEERVNRASAVHWLINEIGVHPTELGPKHFRTNDLFGLWQAVRELLKSEMGGRSPESKETLSRLLEDAGLQEAARVVMGRKNKFMRYEKGTTDSPKKGSGRRGSRGKSSRQVS